MRALTPDEQALVDSVFPDPLPLSAVRLVDGAAGNPAAMIAFRNGNTAITLRRTVYYGRHYRADFTAAEPHARALFLHEMTHVWQYARLGLVRFGYRYMRDLMSVGFRPPAMYRYEPGLTRFAEARLEAQAQMVGDYSEAAGERRAAIARSLAGSGFYGL